MKPALIEGQQPLFALEGATFDVPHSDVLINPEDADYREIANHLLAALGHLAAVNKAQGFLRASEMPTRGRSLRKLYGERFNDVCAARLRARAKSSRAARDEFYTAMGESAPTVLEPGDPDMQLLWLNFRRQYGQTGWEGMTARRELTNSLTESTQTLEV